MNAKLNHCSHLFSLGSSGNCSFIYKDEQKRLFLQFTTEHRQAPVGGLGKIEDDNSQNGQTQKGNY